MSPRVRRLRCSLFSPGLLLTLAILLVGPVRAQDVGVVVSTLSGERATGLLGSLESDLALTLENGETRRFERDSVLRIVQLAADDAFENPSALVLLVNGDSLSGRTLRLEDDAVVLEWSAAVPPETVSVPLEYVRSVVFNQPENDIQRERLQRQWALTRPEADRLLLLNGTYADGELLRVSQEHVVLATSVGEVETPRSEVVAVIMNSELAAVPPRAPSYALMLTADGSRVTLDPLQINEKEQVVAKATAGFPVRLPWSRVRRIHLYGNRVLSLADAEPAEYQFTPYLTERHPLVPNRNVHGGPLKLRDEICVAGIGVHSKSDITYDLTGKDFQTFSVRAGIDDMAEGHGHVRFRVLLDGEPAFASPGVTGKDSPLEIGPIDVSDARTLTLSVDFGRAGNIRDIADWCDPILLK